jgi:hypothetical protein
MAYGSIEDIRLLGYIPEEDLDALDAENTDRIPKLFDAESGKFDAYMRPRYGVPWPDETVPVEVVDAVVAIVVFRLYILRGFPSIPEGSEVAKEIIASRERAEAFRKDIRDGVAQLLWREDATPSNLEAGAKTGNAAMPNQIKSGSFRGTCVGRIPRGGCC